MQFKHGARIKKKVLVCFFSFLQSSIKTPFLMNFLNARCIPLARPNCQLTLKRLGRRGFHYSIKHNVQRLLWCGSVLDQTSNVLQQVPKDWLLAMGMQEDIEQGISFNSLASSFSHSMISYTTLPPALPISNITNESDQNENQPRVNPAGLHKLFSIGRNTFGELGAGFASQESTWSMVRSGFEGAGGIKAIRCGLGTSWIVTNATTEANSESNLFSFGNHTSGQLGLGGESRPYALSVGGEPQLELYSSPRRVQMEEGSIVEAISSGLDHTILLIRLENGKQEVRSCGINTDGQLGVPSIRISSPSFTTIDQQAFQPSLPPSDQDPVVGIAAGGDTSALWTASGRIWCWGNSEYAQGLVGSKPIDRIEVPTEASNDVANAIEGGKVIDIRFGGSFVVLLTDQGDVYTAGFGALGQGKKNLESHKPRKILEGASRISTGLEQASAVLHGQSKTNLAVWGLDTPSGRLGMGVRKPYPSYMLASRFTPDEIENRIYQPGLVKGLKSEWISEKGGILDVAHGRDVMFVLVEDGKDEVGRWSPPPVLI